MSVTTAQEDDLTVQVGLRRRKQLKMALIWGAFLRHPNATCALLVDRSGFCRLGGWLRRRGSTGCWRRLPCCRKRSIGLGCISVAVP